LEAAGIIANKNGDAERSAPAEGDQRDSIGDARLDDARAEGERPRAVADFIDRAVTAKDDSAALSKIRAEVAEFCKRFPMPH
jgi:glycine/serine hydroxymethyltransferase